MTTEVLAGRQIHKASLGGRPLCGTSAKVRISYSGALLLVTCQACRDAMTPNTEAQLASIEAAAVAYRARNGR